LRIKKVISATTSKNHCNFLTTNCKQFSENFDKRLKIKGEKEKLSNSSDRNRAKRVYIKNFQSYKLHIV
jgi:hypothetical protein